MHFDVYKPNPEWMERNPWVCYIGPGDAPPAPVPAPVPTPVPGSPAPAAPAPPTPPAEPSVHLTTAQLNERMARHTRAELAKMGIDPEKVAADAAKLAEMQAAEAKRQKEEMSELDRLRLEKKEAETAMETAKASAAKAQDQAHLVTLCAAKGVRNVKYATFLLGTVKPADRAAELDRLIADPAEKQALKVGITPEATPKTPGSTSPGHPGGPPAPPSPNPANPPAKPVDDMTKEEYAQYKQSRGGR